MRARELRALVDDRDTSWSIGGLGAIAEFHWLPDDRACHPCGDPLEVATARGALRVAPCEGIEVVAYQTPSAHPDRWLQGVVLCLPRRAARMARRGLLTELGPDTRAVRPEDRGALLFDLGVGLPNVDACVRTESPELVATLRAQAGRALLEPGNAAMGAILAASPHRVFASRLGRIEVYQRIGSERAHPPIPPGPHTHLLPELLAARRTHPASTPIPAHLFPCATAYPPNALVDARGERKAFDESQHARFVALLARWGDPAFVEEKQRALRAMRAGKSPRHYRAPRQRRGRDALRIAIRELAQLEGDTPVVQRWRRRFDGDRIPARPRG